MIVRELSSNDLEEIVRIEKELYKTPWGLNQFKYELEENEFSYVFFGNEECWQVFIAKT